MSEPFYFHATKGEEYGAMKASMTSLLSRPAPLMVRFIFQSEATISG